MTKGQLNKLRPGDIVQHLQSGNAYVVRYNVNEVVMAERSVTITNPREWKLKYKSIFKPAK